MPGWKARLGAAAERDYLNILDWTRERFGVRQARAYRGVPDAAIRELRNGPDPPGSRRRGEIAAGLWSLHVARHGRRGRHILLYRATGDGVIEVIRILHDGMEIARHLPPGEGET